MARGAEGNDEIQGLRELIAGSKRVVAMTGAGISTESGIPDFRSPGGLWSRMRPITYQEFIASEEARLEEWRRRFRMNETFADAEPNEGHRGLVRLMQRGEARCTHHAEHRRAASARRPSLGERDRDPRQLDARALSRLPHADAASDRARDDRRDRLRRRDAAAADSSRRRSSRSASAFRRRRWRGRRRLRESADLFLVVGSSLLVQPAASLPLVAKRAGAALAILNRDATPLDSQADLTLQRADRRCVFNALSTAC